LTLFFIYLIRLRIKSSSLPEFRVRPYLSRTDRPPWGTSGSDYRGRQRVGLSQVFRRAPVFYHRTWLIIHQWIVCIPRCIKYRHRSESIGRWGQERVGRSTNRSKQKNTHTYIHTLYIMRLLEELQINIMLVWYKTNSKHSIASMVYKFRCLNHRL